MKSNYSNYRYKKRKKKRSKKQKLAFFLALVLVIVAFVGYFVENNINPVIMNISESKVKSLANKAVISAVNSLFDDNLNYNDIITITVGDDDEVKMIQVNAVVANFLARMATVKAQENIELIGEQGIDIPIGSISGLPILAGRGSKIQIKMLPFGAVVSEFKSDFMTAGINQTRHKIYINIRADVSVVLPVRSKVVVTNTQILIAESIIVGKVPSVYLNSNNLTEMLNLVP